MAFFNRGGKSDKARRLEEERRAQFEERSARPGPFSGRAGGKRRDPKKAMTWFIIALATLLIALLFIYFRILNPAEKTTGTKGIYHILSIYGFGADRFSRPSAVAWDGSRLYVADTGHDAVFVLGDKGRTLIRRIDVKKVLMDVATTRLAKKGMQHTMKLDIRPVGIAVGNGRIFISSKIGDAVYAFNREGKPLSMIRIRWPIALHFVNGRLYVSTGTAIRVLDDAGTRVIASFGSRGRGDEQVDFPNGITADGNGNMYISDSNNTRVVSYSKGMQLRWKNGERPSGLRQKNRLFGMPAGIDLGGDGNVYVVDAFHSTIHVLTSEGKHIDELGARGNEDGQFYYPDGIVNLGGDVFAVADKFNGRVQVIRVDSAKARSLRGFMGCSL